MVIDILSIIPGIINEAIFIRDRMDAGKGVIDAVKDLWDFYGTSPMYFDEYGFPYYGSRERPMS